MKVTREQRIEAYKTAIARIEKEIEILTDGKDLRTETESGVTYHEHFNEIRKLNFDKGEVARRLFVATQE